MPNYQTGSNAGLHGLVDLPGVSAKFEVKINRWAPTFVGNTRPRRGRGGGFFRTVRWTMSSGNIAMRGKVPPTGVPQPTAWKGQTGTITVTWMLNKSISYPIIVTEHGFAYDENKDTIPTLIIAAEITGDPTYSAGWGTQPTSTNPSKADQEQWEGTEFAIDASSLASHGQLLIDWWDDGVADTSAAEITKLAAVIAAAVVPSPFKMKVPSISRDAPDGGIITIPLSLTTTAEDWINPRTAKKIDPNKIQTGGTVAALNATPTIPTISGQTVVERVTTTEIINDGVTGEITEYGQRSTKDDIEMDESGSRVDKSGMDSDGKTTKVYAAGGSPPSDASAPDASLQVVGTSLLNVNLDESKKVTYFKVNTAAEQWVYDHTRKESDASNLKNLTILGAVYTTGSEPGAPGASGLVLNHKEYLTLASPTTSNLSGILWFYGETTAADDETYPRITVKLDTLGLESSAVLAEIITTGDALSNPAPPDAGLKFYNYADSPLTDPSASNKSIRLYFYELVTSAEKIERAESHADVDPNNLESKAQEAFVYNDGDSPPTDFDEVSTPTDTEIDEIDDQQLNDGKWKRIIKKVINNSKNLWERLKAKKTTDVGHVAQDNIVVKVLSTATVSADDTYNADTTNLEFSTAEVIKISATQYAHIYTFKPLSELNRQIEEFKQIVDDPVSNLVADDHRRIIDANATTAAPAVTNIAGASMICVRRVTHKIGRTLYQHDFYYELRSQANKLIAEKTVIVVDASALESEAFTAEVFLISGGASGAGSAPFTNAQNINYRDITVENPLYTLRVYGWALNTNTQKLENQHTTGAGDPYGESPSITATKVSSSGSSAQTLATAYRDANTDPLFLDVDFKTLTPAAALKILKTARDKHRLKIDVTTQDVEVHGIPAGALTSPTVFDPTSIDYSSGDAAMKCVKLYGTSEGLFVPIEISRTRGTYRFRQYYLSDTISDATFDSLVGMTNTSTMLNRPAHTLRYVGHEIMTNTLTASGHRILGVDQIFLYDNWRHFSDSNLSDGWLEFTTPVTDPGWCTPASSFLRNGSFFVIRFPVAADLSSIIA